MNEISLVWINPEENLDIHKIIRKEFENNQLKCEETETGLYITCDNERNIMVPEIQTRFLDFKRAYMA